MKLFLFILFFKLSFSNSYFYSEDEAILPEKYNFFADYPFCNSPKSCENCILDYYEGIIGSFGHRLCKKERKYINLSRQYLLSCDPINNGRKDTSPLSLIYLLEQTGITKEECHPWENIYYFDNEYCNKCKDGSHPDMLKIKSIFTKSEIFSTEDIQSEIYDNGPLCAFLSNIFDGGEEKDSQNKTLYSAEIIGWDKTNDFHWILYREDFGIFNISVGDEKYCVEENVFPIYPK